jgi:pimeloyl-ACP methyl ester carboxylesterase
MPKLAGRFHLIAPDLPSFGFTTVEEGQGYQFTFAGLTQTMQGFVNELSRPSASIWRSPIRVASPQSSRRKA